MAEEQFTPSPTEVTQATKIRASNMNQVLEGIRDLATKKISDFPTSTPTSSDYMLFEHENEEKNTTIKDAVNTCSLTYEEIMASTDLSGKVASASALQQIGGRILVGHSGFPVATSTGKQEIYVSFDTPLPNVPKAVLLTWWDNNAIQGYCNGLNVSHKSESINGFSANTNRLKLEYDWYFTWMVIY